jgi:hypothetical protein
LVSIIKAAKNYLRRLPSALLRGCCTDVTVCIRTRSGMIVIRPAAWSPLMRASC